MDLFQIMHRFKILSMYKMEKSFSNAQILKKQQETTNQLNALIEQSSQAIMCGPECQQKKNTQDLQQKYIDAQTNMKTAPIQLEEAKKNYYLFSEGQNAYNNLLEKELKIKAEKISKLILEKFLEEIHHAKILNFYYNSDIINSKNTIELYENYLKQNKTTEILIRDSKGDMLTNDRKSYYEIQEYDNLLKWNNIFLYFYYFCVVIFIVGLVFLPNQFTIVQKVGFSIIFVIYPFIIDYIMFFLYKIINKIQSYFPKNVYK